MANISGSTYYLSGHFAYYITWSESSVNSANNTSVVSAWVYVQKTGSYNVESSANAHDLWIDGTKFSANPYIDMNPETTPRLLVSGSKTITHNSDGTKNISISSSGQITYISGASYSPQGGSASGTVSLTTITRNAAVTTNSASSVTYNSATANGNVTDAGIPACTDRGIYWGTSSSSQTNKISDGTGGSGSFNVSMTSLSPNTTYYYKAYAYNARYGYQYGSVVSFTTSAVAPAVSSSAVSNIYSVKATGNGNITNVYGANATRRGFCYMTGTTGDPTTSNSVVYDDGIFGTGSFSKVITGLSPSTNYRVRPYAVNSAGTGYGTTVSLTTLTDTPSLDFDESIGIGELYNQRLATKTSGILSSGAYGGFYVGNNYWAGGFTRTFSEELVDSLVISDSGSNIFDFVREWVEALNLSEAFTAGFARSVDFLDSLVVRSASQRVYDLIRSWVESLSITDTITKAVVNVRAWVESISLAETFTASMLYIEELIESIVLSDTVSRAVGKVLSTLVTITDSFSRTIGYVREWAESVLIQEVFTAGRRLVRAFQDTINLLDSLAQISGRYFIDIIGIVDSWTKTWAKTFVEAINITDTLSGFIKAFTRLYEESITLSQSVAKHVNILVSSIVSIIDNKLLSRINGQLVEWSKKVKSAIDWVKESKDRDSYIKIEKARDDWELDKKDLGLYESNVKPLDEWTKLRKEE